MKCRECKFYETMVNFLLVVMSFLSVRILSHFHFYPATALVVLWFMSNSDCLQITVN